MNKFRAFNFRPMFFVLIFLCLGILAVNYFFTNKILYIIVVGIAIAVTLFYSFCYKNFYIILVAIFAFFMGLFGLLYEKKVFEKEENIQVGSVITGKIQYCSGITSPKIIISNVEVDGNSIDGDVLIKVTNYDVINDDCVGDELCCVVDSVQKNSFFAENDIVGTYNVSDNIKYSVASYSIEIEDSKASLKQEILDKFKENLSIGLNNENTELMYSMLFGDKNDLNSNLRSIYNDCGLAHILAVSGMNVGLIIACLQIFLKLVRCNKYVKTGIIISILICYCYLCSWSVSVVRATIMAIVLLIAPLTHNEYDALSSISFAGVIILMFTPSALFDPSFLLSFYCVFGIIMLYPRLEKLLKTCKMDNFLMRAIALSCTTVLMTLCVMILFFEDVNIICILANTLLLPLFSLSFIISFFVTILSLILPFLSYILIIVDYLLSILTLGAKLLVSIKITLDFLTIDYFVTILYFIALFFMSKFNIMERKKRNFVFCTLLLIITGYIAIKNSSLNFIN